MGGELLALDMSMDLELGLVRFSADMSEDLAFDES